MTVSIGKALVAIVGLLALQSAHAQSQDWGTDPSGWMIHIEGVATNARMTARRCGSYGQNNCDAVVRSVCQSQPGIPHVKANPAGAKTKDTERVIPCDRTGSATEQSGTPRPVPAESSASGTGQRPAGGPRGGHPSAEEYMKPAGSHPTPRPKSQQAVAEAYCKNFQARMQAALQANNRGGVARLQALDEKHGCSGR